MQRFADQAAIAWHNALRLEAQQRADSLHKTLERVVNLAPTFHITGTREEVAKAICEAALTTFRVRRGRALPRGGRQPAAAGPRAPLDSLPPGARSRSPSEMPLVREIRIPQAHLRPRCREPSRSLRPWPQEVVRRPSTRSALYVPMRFDEGRPANLLVLAWDEAATAPDESFLVVVQRFADQAALALTNASAERLHARLEASLLPPRPRAPAFPVVTRYQYRRTAPAAGRRLRGFDRLSDGRLPFVIGDVSGHGPDAAALGATLRSTWKALALAGQSPPKIVEVMAQALLAERSAPNAFSRPSSSGPSTRRPECSPGSMPVTSLPCS